MDDTYIYNHHYSNITELACNLNLLYTFLLPFSGGTGVLCDTASLTVICNRIRLSESISISFFLCNLNWTSGTWQSTSLRSLLLPWQRMLSFLKWNLHKAVCWPTQTHMNKQIKSADSKSSCWRLALPLHHCLHLVCLVYHVFIHEQDTDV